MNYQVFWGLTAFTDEIVEVDSSSTHPGVGHTVNDLPGKDASFSIVKDDTNVNVLVVQSDVQVAIKLINSGVTYTEVSTTSEYVGSRPPRRPV